MDSTSALSQSFRATCACAEAIVPSSANRPRPRPPRSPASACLSSLTCPRCRRRRPARAQSGQHDVKAAATRHHITIGRTPLRAQRTRENDSGSNTPRRFHPASAESTTSRPYAGPPADRVPRRTIRSPSLPRPNCRRLPFSATHDRHIRHSPPRHPLPPPAIRAQTFLARSPSTLTLCSYFCLFFCVRCTQLDTSPVPRPSRNGGWILRGTYGCSLST
ncbi:uncharacterized protein B0H18DRAFT_311183 [Fomitopsis serialis]|uniref:uncharacterized protein n=1 Tax=Fomitopsis serialis TaxID=139415 RepID=UPI0020079D55|nr:uncharacterized protein B0H18DRAFT_311183 [Neoantrodia serialis]KAH9936074.1 hypothetical protein B0H18DRAFT_311183 [Neoantrodia serialis]